MDQREPKSPPPSWKPFAFLVLLLGMTIGGGIQNARHLGKRQRALDRVTLRHQEELEVRLKQLRSLKGENATLREENRTLKKKLASDLPTNGDH